MMQVWPVRWFGKRTVVRWRFGHRPNCRMEGPPLTKLLPVALSDRKSTRLNSSHLVISYAVFCLKKKKNEGSPLDLCIGTALLRSQRTDPSGRTTRNSRSMIFFFKYWATAEIYPLPPPDALPI